MYYLLMKLKSHCAALVALIQKFAVIFNLAVIWVMMVFLTATPANSACMELPAGMERIARQSVFKKGDDWFWLSDDLKTLHSIKEVPDTAQKLNEKVQTLRIERPKSIDGQYVSAITVFMKVDRVLYFSLVKDSEDNSYSVYTISVRYKKNDDDAALAQKVQVKTFVYRLTAKAAGSSQWKQISPDDKNRHKYSPKIHAANGEVIVTQGIQYELMTPRSYINTKFDVYDAIEYHVLSVDGNGRILHAEDRHINKGEDDEGLSAHHAGRGIIGIASYRDELIDGVVSIYPYKASYYNTRMGGANTVYAYNFKYTPKAAGQICVVSGVHYNFVNWAINCTLYLPTGTERYPVTWFGSVTWPELGKFSFVSTDGEIRQMQTHYHQVGDKRFPGYMMWGEKNILAIEKPADVFASSSSSSQWRLYPAPPNEEEEEHIQRYHIHHVAGEKGTGTYYAGEINLADLPIRSRPMKFIQLDAARNTIPDNLCE